MRACAWSDSLSGPGAATGSGWNRMDKRNYRWVAWISWASDRSTWKKHVFGMEA